MVSRVKRRKPIYVESRIRCSIDDLWEKTQDPRLHQRWDLRFGDIHYEPEVKGEPQRFSYSTTVAPGMTVGGKGESLGDKHRPDGARWSGLRFWSDDWRSPIKTGAGYWRYLPTDDGIRFLTRFDYQPRWGKAGELIDKFVFRPLFGWGTAWSFDRLRIWLETGISPEESRNRAAVHQLTTATVAGAWIFHGLVPKILKRDPAEVSMLRKSGFSKCQAPVVAVTMGIAESAFGAWILARPRSRAPMVAHLMAIPVLTVGAWRADRTVFSKAFNPVSTNAALFALGVVALTGAHDLPSGRRPLRSAPDQQPNVGTESIPGDKE
jgi:hypothetical protein